MQNIEILISKDDIEKIDPPYRRLDQYLASQITYLSRTAIKTLFKKKLITCSTSKIDLKSMPAVGSLIIVQIPPPMPIDAQAENLPLQIIYEDNDLLIINKSAGMVTHPAPGNYTGTLVNAVLYHCKDLQSIGDKIRPGIVHRLDKGTSGLMVVAKNQLCHERLVVIFSKHDIKRKYIAIAINSKILNEGTIESFIARSKKDRKKMANYQAADQGKFAQTHYKVLKYYKRMTLIELTLATGRTHQIRVHLSGILNAPILMDSCYGNIKSHLHLIPNYLNPILKNYQYPLLHAKELGFIHPITKKELFFEIDPPSTFQQCLNLLDKNEL